jgi:hypothetical protein
MPKKNSLRSGESYLTIIIETPLKNDFEKACKRDERTMSGTLRKMIKDFISKVVE